MQKLRETLDALGENIENITNGTTNSGGCGRVAHLVGQRLTRMGWDVCAKVENYSPVNLDDKRVEFDAENMPDDMRAEEWTEGEGFAHIFLEITDGETILWWDSERSYINPYDLGIDGLTAIWMLCEGSLTLTELEDVVAYNPWNPTFDTRNMPAIEEVVGEWLSLPHRIAV